MGSSPYRRLPVCLDGASFAAFHNLVVSAMTGSFVTVGLGIGALSWPLLAPAVCALGGYITGLVVGTVTVGLTERRLPTRGAISTALALETVVLGGFALVWFLGGPAHAFPAGAMIAAATAAMGLQGAALRRIGPAGTPTNYFTGVVTNWVSGMVDPAGRAWNLDAGARIAAFVAAAATASALHRVAPVAVITLPLLLVVAATTLTVAAARVRRPAGLRLVTTPTHDKRTPVGHAA